MTILRMDVARLIDQLESEGRRLVAGLAAADWSAAVPGTDWDLRTVVRHLGAVHRWATDILVRGLATNETGGSKAFHEAMDDQELSGWLVAGHSILVATLRDADDDLAAFTLMRSPNPRHFWARRQAHETAIHRADVQATLGTPGVQAFDPAFAQDGIAELVDGFAREPQFAAADPGVLALRCTDGPSWLITFGDGTTRAARTGDTSAATATATATVTGTSSALYLWVWNRPADVVQDGDVSTIASWQRIRI